MKLEPHLPQLPTIGELLEHPRVKSVVARINGSTLAHRATGFLEELRSSLVERAGRVEIPSVAQLAERLARRLMGEPLSNGPVINATGIVIGAPDLVPPLAEVAVHAMIQIASDYHGRGSHARHAAELELCNLSGAEAALILSSFDAALGVVLSTAAANREILVSTRANAEVAAIDWPRLTARYGAVLRTSAGDVASLSAAVGAGPGFSALLRSPDDEGLSSTNEVANVAKSCGAIFIDVATQAGVLNPQTYGLHSFETLGERIAAGADLVIADGAGLIGGPACGVIVGKRKLVEAAAAHYLASIAAIDAASAAALHSTLAAYRGDHDGSAAFTIPVWQLLSTPLGNLQQRAERLAALMAASAGIASAEAREADTPWRQTGELSVVGKTWVIAVRPKSGDANSLLVRLRQPPHPVAATAVEGAVHVDLRSIFPRWDQQLVAAFTEIEG